MRKEEKMDISQHLIVERLLCEFMGKQRFESAKKEVESIVTAYNLDSTPEILKDFFAFIQQEIAFTRI